VEKKMKKWLLTIIFMIFSFCLDAKLLCAQDAKDYIAQISSPKSFLANILKGAFISDDIVLEKTAQDSLLRRQSISEEGYPQPVFESKLWTNGGFAQKRFSKSHSWQEDFDASALNINVGLDISAIDFGGIFLSRYGIKARQKNESGEIEDMRIGVYKSFFSRDVFIHSVISFGNQGFKIKKEGSFDYFDSYTLRIAVDSDFNPKNQITPFIGMRTALAFNDDIRTHYEDSGEVEIPGDIYSRFEGLGGIKAHYLKDQWTLILKAYAISVFKGAKTHYGSIEGNHEDMISAASELGAQYKIGSSIILFANGAIRQGALTSEYRANAGFTFMIKPAMEVKILSDIEDIKVPNYLSLNVAESVPYQEIDQARIVSEISLNGRMVENSAARTSIKQIAFLSDDSYVQKSAVLKPKAKSELKSIALSIQNEEHSQIIVIGHAANEKSEAENEALSSMRAQQTAMELEKNGIAKDKILYYGLGSKVPFIVDNQQKDENDGVEILAQ
jgi:outer membrane protein OmpA-like peptidoglycan-associated protein